MDILTRLLYVMQQGLKFCLTRGEHFDTRILKQMALSQFIGQRNELP